MKTCRHDGPADECVWKKLGGHRPSKKREGRAGLTSCISDQCGLHGRHEVAPTKITQIWDEVGMPILGPHARLERIRTPKARCVTPGQCFRCVSRRKPQEIHTVPENYENLQA